MPDATTATRATRITPALAVVGLACRFPDSDDPAALLDAVLTGRRSFRRIPPARMDLADYYQPDLAIADATYSTRAAVIEGWRFECAPFGIEPAAYAAADPAHWLALETAARALAAAGLPAGSGLDRDRTGVIIGNTLGGDVSRANALRVRWPYVRRVLTEALGTQEISASQAGGVLRRAETRYLAPFPAMGKDSLAGSMPGTIAAAISNYFGFRGGSHAVDSACSSSLQAVASACAALASGDLDAAIAGGVDLSLDPLELIGLAKAGLLAATDVRIYDQNPTGYLPGEGCGVVVLMRTADARAAGLPVYAEILGWGTSGGGMPGETQAHASNHLLAMQRAYERAGVDPTDIQFIEGNGAGTLIDDAAELSALSSIRAGAKRPAALGSVKANIGHAKAAAGAAALIKTVLALGTGVVPPTTGVDRPHEMITGGDARLVLPQSAAEWEDGTRLAAVSTMGIGGSNVHLVLRHEPAGRTRQDRWLRSMPLLARAVTKSGSDSPQPRLATAPEATPFLLQAPDKLAMAAVLSRLADTARWMSDAELQDLACMLGRDTGKQGRVKVGLVATRQHELAVLAKEAVTLLPQVAYGLVTVRPGIFAADDADGRVTLLLSGDPASAAGSASQFGPVAVTSAVTCCLDALRWLESLDVHATAAVGHGLGALAGLAWIGVLGETEVAEIADLRAQYLLRSVGYGTGNGTVASEAGNGAGAADGSGSAALRTAIAQRFRFGPPRRRLISTLTGAEIESVDDAIDLICSGFAGADRLTEAIADGAVGATLLLETGPGRTMASAAAEVSKVPAISLQSGFTDPVNSAQVAAALFAAGALGQPQPLFAGRSARPVDIWREQVFITNPCQVIPQPRTAAESTAAKPAAAAAQSGSVVEATDAADHALGKAASEDDGISGLRDEFERRLPARPLITAATGRPADTANPAPARQAAAEAGTPASTDEEVRAESPASTDEAVRAESPVLSDPPPAPAPPGALARPVILGKPVVLAEAAAPAAPARTAAVAQFAESDASASADRSRANDKIAVSSAPAAGLVAGIGPWARCFTEELRPRQLPARPAPTRPWRMYAASRSPVLADVSGLFSADPGAGRTLAIVEDPADERSRATAVEAARDAITTGELVVLTTSAEFTGFFASLHAEHPEIGITVVRIPADATGPAPIADCATAERGKFRELVISSTGTASEPVLSPAALAGGTRFPLGPEDVILISRSTGGGGLALAQVLACCGTGIAVVGRAAEHDDGELVACLEQLRSAGARVGYEVIDIGDQASLAAAVRRIEDRLGPVKAIGHAAGPADRVPFLDLTDAQIRAHLTTETGTLDRLAGSIRAGQLKLIVAGGTLAARYGMAGASMHALGSGAVASRAAQLAEASIGCQIMHLDMPAWSTDGLGDQPELAAELAAADTPPLDVSTASRMLIKIMTTPELPRRLALHGRVGGLAARPAPVITSAELTAAGLPHGARFLRDTAVHYPGIELVCSASMSLSSDPYLSDYRIDGMPVLPPVLALEALAQAASVLAGRPVRRATDVSLGSPVLIPSTGMATLRVCALRDGDRIVAALRCADSFYRVDHARAEFSCAPDLLERPEAASAAASSGLQQLVAGPSGLVDGGELYGPICFQSGRFRRIALLPEVTARSGRALARGVDDHPWFANGSDLSATTFLLGSPGLNDAALQVLQACVPHRRVRPAGCESVEFFGRSADGPVEIRAIAEPVRPATMAESGAAFVPGQAASSESERATAQPQPMPTLMPAPAPAVDPQDMTAEELADLEIADRRPQSRKSRRGRRQQGRRTSQAAASAPAHSAARNWDADPGDILVGTPDGALSPAADVSPAAEVSPPQVPQLWNIEAVDAAGQLIATWRGVYLHDSGPLPRNAAWPPTLLSVFLERRATDLGLDEGLRVTVSCGQPEGAPQLLSGVPEQSSPPDGHTAGGGRHAGPERRTMNAVNAPGLGALAGFGLALRAPVPVACGWVTVDPSRRQHQPAPGLTSAHTQLRNALAEPSAVLAARVEAVSACLGMAGLQVDGPAGDQLTVTRTTGDGWAVFALGRAHIACTVVELSGVSAPVAIALLTRRHAHARARNRLAAPVTTS